MKHGSRSGYRYSGCRCDDCRAWNAANVRRSRLRRVSRGIPPGAKHGDRNLYVNYGCRCEACTIVNKVVCAKYDSDVKAGLRTRVPRGRVEIDNNEGGPSGL